MAESLVQKYYRKYHDIKNIGEYNNLLKELVEKCKISCNRCLDTKKLWKSRD